MTEAIKWKDWGKIHQVDFEIPQPTDEDFKINAEYSYLWCDDYTTELTRAWIRRCLAVERELAELKSKLICIIPQVNDLLPK